MLALDTALSTGQVVFVWAAVIVTLVMAVIMASKGSPLFALMFVAFMAFFTAVMLYIVWPWAAQQGPIFH